jgi:hypothetical protein
MKNIAIAKNLHLPLDIITQTIAILAKRRVGKSYTMRRLVEQLFEAGQQIVLIDPKGDQWGIRSSADGKRPGLPVVILGGEHGDVPLEPNGGELVAKLVVEERVSALLDLSLFRKHEVATFMTGFLENLYRLKAQERYRTPMMLVVDEADAIAPQKPQRGEERMLGAAEDIVRRGGQRGIGCTLVTQRSAVLNKNVLTQAQMLIVLRTIAPQDLAAMNAWVDVHGEPEQRKVLMASLPSLPVGDAWFWSPGWPTAEGIFKLAHVLPIDTFDSGATPRPGETPVVPKNLADVDLDALKTKMAATIEKAKADDPRALRTEIATLKKELTLRGAAAPAPKAEAARVKIERIEVPTVGKKALQGIKTSEASMRKMLKAVKEALPGIETGLDKLTAEVARINDIQAAQAAVRPAPLPAMRPVHIQSRPTVPTTPASEGITGPEQRVLNGIAWMEKIGISSPVNEIVAFLAGYGHALSKGYTVPRGALKSRGLINYPVPGTLSLTSEGRAYAQFPADMPTREELHRTVLDRLDGPKRRVLEPLLRRYPDDMSNEDLCVAAGYSHALSKGYTVPRGKLKTFGLIEYPTPGRVRAGDILFI